MVKINIDRLWCISLIGWILVRSLLFKLFNYRLINLAIGGKAMDYINKFFKDDSGSAEAASSAIMIGMGSGLSGIWNGGLSGIWDSLTNNHPVMILVVFTLAFIFWIMFKV